jgi:type III pantothenate kinase
LRFTSAMNLIFDIGNSNTKVALFDGLKKIISFPTRHYSSGKIGQFLQDYKIEKAIISSVRDFPEFIYDLLTVNIPYTIVLSPKSRFPFTVNYETPETLGSDRLAAVAGAWFRFPGENILIIDAGSAVTFDYLSGNTYLGGNISPGLSMRFKALHKFTSRLPLISTSDKFSSPGTNTAGAITAGVINGMIFEINEYIRQFEEKFKEAKVIITGGDSGYLSGKIAGEVNFLPDIVIEGLNQLLEYNAEKA